MFSKNDLNLALRTAANNSDVDKMRSLLQAGAEVNSAGVESGLTALHRAASKGHLPAIMLLIDHGANLEVLSKKTEKNEAQTPYDLAIENNHQHVADYLMLALQAHDAKTYAQKFFIYGNGITTDFKSYRDAQEQFVRTAAPDLQVMKNKIMLDYPQAFYYLWLYEVISPLVVADQRKFYKGLSREYACTAACYLWEHLPHVGINDSIELVMMTAPDGKNHAFLVLGRAPSDIYDLNSWGNALICDADPSSTFNIYTCKKIKDTPLEEIHKKSVEVEILFTSVRPNIDPLVIAQFLEKEKELRSRAINILYAKTGKPMVRENKKPIMAAKYSF